MRIILLNGAPRSGKDTIGRMLWSRIKSSVQAKFADPIISFMFLNHGIRMDTVEKDQPHKALNGRTPREVAIAYSEKFCKPLFGQDYFGRLAVEAVLRFRDESHQEVVIFTDSGFSVEALPLCREFGNANVLQVKISRPGTSFNGDSRSLWHLDEVGCVGFENDSPSVGALRDKVDAILLPEIRSWLS